MLTTTPVSDLPWDIIIELLSRLPVKSLMRFKCVSTSFYNLISNDPLLKKKHLYHHQSSLKVLVSNPPDTRGENANNSCCILSISPAGDAREEITDLEFPIRIGFPQHGWITNSCDGLFCIGDNRDDFVIIWNPSTRQAKRFPCGHREDERGCNTYSLAHDSRSNVYKLLGVFGVEKSRFRFYSTEMEMWRCVEECPPCASMNFFYDQATVVNGAFHWLCCHRDSYFGYSDDDDRKKITPHVVTLDICDETYGMLAMPKSFYNITDYPPTLHAMKGKLCVMCRTKKSQTCWEVWVMNEYGVADSMTRMFSLSRYDIPKSTPVWPVYTPEFVEKIMMHEHFIGTSFYKEGRLLGDPILLCDRIRGKNMTAPRAFLESLISPHTFLEKVSSSNEIVVVAK